MQAGLCLKSQDGHLGKNEVRQVWVGLDEQKSWQCQVGLAAVTSTTGASSVKPQGSLCLGKGALPPLACPFLLGLPCAQREGEPCGVPSYGPHVQGRLRNQARLNASSILSAWQPLDMDASSPVSFKLYIPPRCVFTL